MIFGSNNAQIEVGGDIKTIESEVGDIGVIFQILSGLYNDPQRIIVQEYVANARDAHREINKHEVPIEITLPTPLQSELKIRDFGPGISPDRMENVFVKYGASTKRGDNLQTGGFGIGAKSVFCYTDTCTIETWVNGTYYNYCYMVGDDKKPKCMLMDSSPSDEPNGTRISINITKSDLYTVCSNVYFVTQYWKTRPVIVNPNAYNGIKYTSYETLTEGDNWRFLKNRNSKCYCIIDEIPYKFDFDAVFKEDHEKAKFQSIFNKGNFDFILDNGMVTMSPNREGPIYDPTTRKLFKSVIETAMDVIRDKVTEHMKSIDNIFDALRAYNESSIYSDIIGNFKWRGFELSDRFKVDSNFYTTYHAYRGRSKSKIGHCYEIKLGKGYCYILQDEEVISPAKMKTLMLNYSEVFIFEPVKYEEDTLPKKFLTMDDYQDSLNEYNDKINISAFNLIPLSTVEKFKNPRVAKSDKVNIYEFHYVNYNKPMTNWNGLNVDFSDLDGYYIEYERGTPVGYTLQELKKVQEKFRIKIYGVPSKYMKLASKMDNITSINDFALDSLTDMAEYIKQNNDVIYANNNISYCHVEHPTLKRLSPEHIDILKKSEHGLAYFNASNKIIDDASKHYDTQAMDKFNTLLEITKRTNHMVINPTENIKALSEQLLEKYPLIPFLDQFWVTNIHREHLKYYLEYMITVKPNMDSAVIVDDLKV